MLFTALVSYAFYEVNKFQSYKYAWILCWHIYMEKNILLPKNVKDVKDAADAEFCVDFEEMCGKLISLY